MLSMPRIVRPDLLRIRGTEIGFPAEPATRWSIKQNKELTKASAWQITASSGRRAAAENLAGGFETYLTSKKQYFIAGSQFFVWSRVDDIRPIALNSNDAYTGSGAPSQFSDESSGGVHQFGDGNHNGG